MFYELQSSAYFLNDMKIVIFQPLLSLSSTNLKFGRWIVLAAKKGLGNSHNFSGWNIIYSTDAIAKFFITQVLIVDIKLI
jgi:hypothetical protein